MIYARQKIYIYIIFIYRRNEFVKEDPFQPINSSDDSFDDNLTRVTTEILNSSAFPAFRQSALPGINLSNVTTDTTSNNNNEKTNEEKEDDEDEEEITNVFAENGDILILPKRKLLRHQLSKRENVPPSKLKGSAQASKRMRWQKRSRG